MLRKAINLFAVTFGIAVICFTFLLAPSAAQESAKQEKEAQSQETDFFFPELFLLRERWISNFDLVATFFGPMPTGVTVSDERRIFVNFPRWEDPVQFTVTELRNGRAVPYPNAEINRLDLSRPSQTFVSVQSVVIDPQNRLWILDTGSINFGPVVPGGAKLVGVNLSNNQVFKTIVFPPNVALPTSYLNDVRFDLRRGTGGVAFITDSSDTGPNGIVVVDLATGNSVRRLNDHPTTKAEPGFLPFVEGRELRPRQPGQPPQFIRTGSDGIAISADGERLFYCPLASRRLFSVSTDALVDLTLSDEQVGATVEDLGQKPAADGLESDAQGRVYSTAYETNGVVRRRTDGTYETLLFDPRVIWPDTLSLANDGNLYLINNQLNRLRRFNNGQDLRQRPFSLLRIPVNAAPVRLQ